MPKVMRRQREPLGTTRKGQVLLGGLGLVIGVGFGLGLKAAPNAFEPLLRFALYSVGKVVGGRIAYDPSQRIWFEIGLPVLGLVWALLFARAFLREPARNRAIDAHLWRQTQVERDRHGRVVGRDYPAD